MLCVRGHTGGGIASPRRSTRCDSVLCIQTLWIFWTKEQPWSVTGSSSPSPTEDVIPKLACRSRASRRSLIRLRVLCSPTMYCVERSNGADQWVQEQCFKTEFKAFVNARAKSLAFTNVYRVIYESPGLSGEVVRVSNGKALLNSDDRLVG